jgi:hypothetical protein
LAEVVAVVLSRAPIISSALIRMKGSSSPIASRSERLLALVAAPT